MEIETWDASLSREDQDFHNLQHKPGVMEIAFFQDELCIPAGCKSMIPRNHCENTNDRKPLTEIIP